jgi:hypothetical protein
MKNKPIDFVKVVQDFFDTASPEEILLIGEQADYEAHEGGITADEYLRATEHLIADQGDASTEDEV